MDEKKRKYVSRKEEFFTYNIDHLKDVVLKETTEALKKVVEEQAATGKTAENELKRRELNNKRVRIYSRLRQLGYKAQEMRTKEVPVKVEEPKKEETPPPATV